jgi:hypothetical protein
MINIDDDYDYIYDYLELLQNGEEDLSVNTTELNVIIKGMKDYGIKSLVIEPDDEEGNEEFYRVRKGE